MGRVLLLLLLWAAGAVAGQPGMQYDDTEVSPRPVPEETLARLQADPAFDYARPQEPPRTLWDRLRDWLGRFLMNTAGRLPLWAQEAVFYAAAVAVLAAALVVLLRMRRQGLLERRSEPLALDDALAAEGIERVDLQRWLAEALAEGRHREAVRLHFLLALQALAAADRIDWKPDKTNRQYAAELRGSAPAEPFAALAGRFERVWYGHYAADAGAVEASGRELDRLRETLGAHAGAAA